MSSKLSFVHKHNHTISSEKTYKRLEIKPLEATEKGMEELYTKISSPVTRISQDHVIEDLAIKSNIFSNKMAGLLAAAIESNETLRVLTLENCKFNEYQFQQLCQAISSHPSLEVLNLHGFKMTLKEAIELGKVL